jgi:hypothetical protein
MTRNRTLASLLALAVGSIGFGSVATAAGKAAAKSTVGGIPGKSLKLSKGVSASVDNLASNSSYGGFFATSVKVEPAALRALAKSPAKLKRFIAAATNYLDEGGFVTGMKLQQLQRNQLFGAILDNEAKSGGASWIKDSQKPFEGALRSMMPALLRDKSVRVMHWSGNPQDDWSTDAWVALSPKSGRVFSLVQDGDM